MAFVAQRAASGAPSVWAVPEAGMVTAETAVALPAVVLVLAVCLGGVRVGVDQMRCVDAARAGARAAARGDADDSVRTLAERAAPPGSQVVVEHGGSDVVVIVQAPAVVDLPLPVAMPRPQARAVSAAEGDA